MDETCPAPAGRRERKKQATRARILDEAAALIGAYGLAATTMDRIAVACDLAQATVFNYFGSKAVLVEALTGRLVERWDAVLAEAEATDAPVSLKIGLLFDRSGGLTSEDHRLLRDLIVEAAGTPTTEPHAGLALMRARLRADVAAGQERGEVRADEDPMALADGILGLYVAALAVWSEADDPSHDRFREAGHVAAEMLGPTSDPTR